MQVPPSLPVALVAIAFGLAVRWRVWTFGVGDTDVEVRVVRWVGGFVFWNGVLAVIVGLLTGL